MIFIFYGEHVLNVWIKIHFDVNYFNSGKVKNVKEKQLPW